jgi:hypothetical protein
MKTFYRTILLAGLFILLSSSAWVNLTLVHPAAVNLPQHIQTLIIIDRTITPNAREDKKEATLTGEASNQDQQAVQQVIEGVIYTVSHGDRFKIIRTTERFVGDPTGKVFPQAMSWQDITQLCTKYKADGALVIESFDSDFILTHGSTSVQRTSSGLPGLSFYAKGLATVDMGFRIYDPDERVLSDAYLFHHQMQFEAGGNSIADAIQGVLNKTEAIKQVSYEAGNIYGERITPTYYTVTRYFYDKPKRNNKLSEGVRRSKVADWSGAIDSWQQALDIARKRKHKGRICLNIAVGYEVLGNLDNAMEWASKAYVDYNEKMADDYMRQLKARINEEAVVNRQMGNE